MKLTIVLFNTGRPRQNELNKGLFKHHSAGAIISQCCTIYWAGVILSLMLLFRWVIFDHKIPVALRRTVASTFSAVADNKKFSMSRSHF
jgi:hypothetical protein